MLGVLDLLCVTEQKRSGCSGNSAFLSEFVIFVRTPSKQKSPKKEEEVNIVELLRGHDPKDYEQILRHHNIQDYRSILQALDFLKKEKEMETGKVVRRKKEERAKF